jgi:hypothetical protein
MIHTRQVSGYGFLSIQEQAETDVKNLSLIFYPFQNLFAFKQDVFHD